MAIILIFLSPAALWKSALQLIKGRPNIALNFEQGNCD